MFQHTINYLVFFWDIYRCLAENVFTNLQKKVTIMRENSSKGY